MSIIRVWCSVLHRRPSGVALPVVGAVSRRLKPPEEGPHERPTAVSRAAAVLVGRAVAEPIRRAPA